MPPHRKKPFSAKQKKEQLKAKKERKRQRTQHGEYSMKLILRTERAMRSLDLFPPGRQHFHRHFWIFFLEKNIFYKTPGTL